jgi:protocatechuate 3,4-dioxygenase beta subunit
LLAHKRLWPASEASDNRLALRADQAGLQRTPAICRVNSRGPEDAPVPYPGRTPHIHFAIKANGMEKFTTQCYVKGAPGNARDGILNGIQDAKSRDSVIVDFAPVSGSRVGELAARFDIVLGLTPRAGA